MGKNFNLTIILVQCQTRPRYSHTLCLNFMILGKSILELSCSQTNQHTNTQAKQTDIHAEYSIVRCELHLL